MSFRVSLLALLVLSVGLVRPVPAQPVTLTHLPPDAGNARFFRDAYPVQHPSLSLNGFDCRDAGGTCAHGLGLKQVLEKAYADRDPLVLPVLRELIRLATDDGYISAPASYGQVRTNTSRLQARAFVALAAYVLHENGYDPTVLRPALPAPDVAIRDLRAALLDGDSWTIHGAMEPDAMKWATPATNVARALDLYLALENAFRHYDSAAYADPQASVLITKREKASVLEQYTRLITDLEYYGGEYGGVIGLDGYDIQAGNWPLKVQVAIGYALLTWQDNQTWTCDDVTTCNFDGWLERAFEAAGQRAGDDRYRYWRYQSDDGRFFWAEGPFYYHITISQVIPFWHAARINGLLTKPRLTGVRFDQDPFFTDWLVRPLSWLADLATPDGKTPPLDDGNKQTMYNAVLLRWADGYGPDALGRKYAWIGTVAGRSDLLPVEIAIPRQATPESNPLPPVVGNTSAIQTGEGGRQEIVVRRHTGAHTHYLLLNGESGDAIRRGEGHEQADQMQLLYYVDGVSYLADSGYDRPAFGFPSWRPGTWSHYDDHNVLTVTPDVGADVDGGVRAPWLSWYRLRVVSDHQPVDALYRERVGNIDLLAARMLLHRLAWAYTPIVTYWRRVLFIDDPERPYLIDVNAAASLDDETLDFGMRYHANTDRYRTLLPEDDEAILFQEMYESTSGLTPPRADGGSHDLFLQPFHFRGDAQVALHDDTIREVYTGNAERGEGVPIYRLQMEAEAETFTSIALLRPLPDDTPPPAPAHAGRPLPPDASLDWQVVAWPHSSTVVDVLVARSARAFADPTSREPIHVAIADADDFTVTLPDDKNVGFARLVRQDGVWRIAPDYQMHLVAGSAEATPTSSP